MHDGKPPGIRLVEAPPSGQDDCYISLCGSGEKTMFFFQGDAATVQELRPNSARSGQDLQGRSFISQSRVGRKLEQPMAAEIL